MEDVNLIIKRIAQISYDNLPVEKGWERYEIDVYTLSKYTELEATYYLNDGEAVSFNPEYENSVGIEDDLTFVFLKLREQMYKLSPAEGAWFSCKFIFFSSGDYKTIFNYDDEPDFEYKPSKEQYIEELKKYPRETTMPNWLKQVTNQK
jgi:hypothetical protein